MVNQENLDTTHNYGGNSMDSTSSVSPTTLSEIQTSRGLSIQQCDSKEARMKRKHSLLQRGCTEKLIDKGMLSFTMGIL